MASTCNSLAPFYLSIPHPRFALRSSNSVGLPLKIRCFGIPLLAERRLVALPRRSVLASSIGDGKIPLITGKSWGNLVLESETPVLVEFYAPWCGPCRMVHRVIDEIATDYSGRLKCFVINADSDSQLAEYYEINAVPVVLLFKNGEKYESVIGTMPKEFYAAAIERLLAP